ncbi:MAG TPA: hypothetical protein VMJ32_16030 [Pirellulales bacterium]|nr:hypothetical protein [Pirellulales bacterium]
MIRYAPWICFFAIIIGTAVPSFAGFIGGDLVILSTATNTDTDTAASAITLYDYPYNSLTGTFGTTPTAHSISGLTLPGANDHDGLLHLSTNDNVLTFGGYQAAVGTASVITSGSAHEVGVVDSNWNVTTVPVSNYTGVSLRSVVSTDGKHFWTGGDQGTDGGQYYIDASGATTTQTLITGNDARGNRIVGTQLWSFSSSTSGTNYGNSLPTSAAPQISTMNSPYVKSDVIFLDLNNDGTDETAYSTDGKNLLGKWYFDGTNWNLVGTWTGTKTSINNINSLEAFVYQGNVELLAATQLGQLFQFTDTNGINSSFGGASFATTTPTPYLTIGGTASFRGMAILSVPEPATVTLLAAAIPFFLGCRRWRVR